MKIKQVFLFLIGLVCLTNCKDESSNHVSLESKDTQLDTIHNKTLENKTIINGNQIIFGKYCGMCSENCAIMYRFTLDGNKNTFSADFTNSFFKKSELQFNTSLNDEFHLNIGNEILTRIPNILTNSDKKTEKFGCPDCTDGCGIYFEQMNNGQKQQFYIDNLTSNLTGEIKEFAEFLQAKLDQIKKHRN